MNRLRKLVESNEAGQRTGREAFVLRLETLPTAETGFKWRDDETFNAADAILDEPSLKAMFSAAIKNSHVILKRRPRSSP